MDPTLPASFRSYFRSADIPANLWLIPAALLLIVAGEWLELSRGIPFNLAVALGVALLTWAAGRMWALFAVLILFVGKLTVWPGGMNGAPVGALMYWLAGNQFGIHVIIVLLTARLHLSRSESAHFASRDRLTGLLNREALLETLTAALAARGRTRRVVAVACLDGDCFKAVNDAHGHPEGDRCLQVTAEILRENLRDDDSIARMGGDEFVVVLSSADAGHVPAIIERVLHGLRIGMAEAGWNLTYSIGAAIVGPGRFSAEQVWEAADQAMYIAKRESGGNAVHIVECRPDKDAAPAPT